MSAASTSVQPDSLILSGSQSGIKKSKSKKRFMSMSTSECESAKKKTHFQDDDCDSLIGKTEDERLVDSTNENKWLLRERTSDTWYGVDLEYDDEDVDVEPDEGGDLEDTNRSKRPKLSNKQKVKLGLKKNEWNEDSSIDVIDKIDSPTLDSVKLHQIGSPGGQIDTSQVYYPNKPDSYQHHLDDSSEFKIWI